MVYQDSPGIYKVGNNGPDGPSMGAPGMTGPGPPPGGMPMPPSSGPPAKTEVSAYNFTREQWETLQNVQQHPALPHPEELMSREGRVLVKLEVSQGTASFSLPALVAEVESF